ncbi:hypothetical protein [Saccharopolyspora sp. NPDC002376]
MLRDAFAPLLRRGFGDTASRRRLADHFDRIASPRAPQSQSE